MKLLQAVGISSRNSVRCMNDLFIGSNVKLRQNSKTRHLAGVKVAVLHSNSRALLAAKVLYDHGAEVSNYSLKRENGPNMKNVKVRELDLASKQGKTYLENVLRKTDVFVDGIGPKLEELGISKPDLVRKNGQLIVASVDDHDAFAAVNSLNSVAIGLYLREKEGSGKVVEQHNSKAYQEQLTNYLKDSQK